MVEEKIFKKLFPSLKDKRKYLGTGNSKDDYIYKEKDIEKFCLDKTIVKKAFKTLLIEIKNEGNVEGLLLSLKQELGL